MEYGPRELQGTNTTVCLPRYNDGSEVYEQRNASFGSTVKLSFGGAPPYELKRQIWRDRGVVVNGTEQGGMQCSEVFTTLNESTYTWNIDWLDLKMGKDYDPTIHGVSGESVTFLAIEKSGTDQQRVYNSANYTLSNSAKSTRTTYAGLAVVALLIVPTLSLF